MEELNRINDDVLLIIFSKLALKTLIQCRSVSKLWRSLIDNPFLATFHLSQQSSPDPCILSLATYNKTKSFRVLQEKSRTLKRSDNPISELKFKDSSMTLEGSCNGLLCYSDRRKQRLSLLNPLRNEVFTLPSFERASPNWVISGFGYDRSSNKYKVVMVVYEELESHVSRTKVYTLGTSSWREIAETPPYPIHGKPVYAHGSVHWLVSPFVNDQKGMVVGFHVGKEEFSFTPHPRFDSNDVTLFGLLEMKGELAMVDLSREEKIDIWVMKDYEKKEWVMEYEIGIGVACGRVNHGNTRVIGLWEDGEVLLQTDGGFFIYNDDDDEKKKKNGLRYSQSLGLESDYSGVLRSHRWSLISINSLV